MDGLYLISHKVRNEVAFDVALRVALSGGEEIWFIPTSGHGAYPYEWCADAIDGARWAALPDHYPEPCAEPRPSLVARLRARLQLPALAWLREWLRAKRDVGELAGAG